MREREYGIDIIKSLAIFFVIIIHGLSFSTLKFIKISNENVSFLVVILQILSMSAIPLFLMVSGYLGAISLREDLQTKKYTPLLISYFVAVSISLIFDHFYHRDKLSLKNVIAEYFDLNSGNYSWYVLMYMLFLLIIPYINIVIRQLKDKNKFRQVVLISTLITAIAPFINSLTTSLAWPITYPAFFVNLYPITYYLIGAYIKTYKVKFNKLALLLCLLVLVLSLSCFIQFWYQGGKADFDIYGSYASISYLMIALLIFLLLYDLKIKRKTIQNFFVSISISTLDIYLISHVFDRIFYPLYNDKINRVNDLLVFLLIPVLATFASSYIYAKILLKLRTLAKNKPINNKTD